MNLICFVFQIDEIEEAGLQIGEDESIAEELKRLDSFDHIDKGTWFML